MRLGWRHGGGHGERERRNAGRIPAPDRIEGGPAAGLATLPGPRVYGVAKTVVDCFKYRNKIGLDVALEALRESRRERACTMDELWRYAKTCRVANVMRPYLESVA